MTSNCLPTHSDDYLMTPDCHPHQVRAHVEEVIEVGGAAERGVAVEAPARVHFPRISSSRNSGEPIGVGCGAALQAQTRSLRGTICKREAAR